MRLLLLKALRDLKHGWISFGACTLLVALASALFVAFLSSFLNITRSCEATYRELKFENFSMTVDSAPASLTARLESLPGIEAVTGRRVTEVGILKEPVVARNAPILGRVLSVPAHSRPQVNDVQVEEGRYLTANRGEILVEKRFADGHGYRVGDVMTLRSRDQLYRMTIVGLVSSPEYLWLATDRYDPRPAAERLGVLFVSESDARSLSGAPGINEIHVRVSAPEQRDALMAEAARCVSAYLEQGPFPREEHPSHVLVMRDRRAFAGLAVVFPTIFLSLSTIVLFSTMWQLVSRQRQQVGILMAQGFSGVPIALHYLAMAGLVGAGGALGGVAGGSLLGLYCTHLYSRTLGVVVAVTGFYPWLGVLAVLGASLVSVGAGWVAVHRVLDMDPLEALRPEFSTRVRAFRPERWVPFLKGAGFLLRLPLRNLLRHPLRTAITLAGVLFSVAQVVMVAAIFDSQRATLDFFFGKVHTYTLQADTRGVLSPAALPPLYQWPEVLKVETCLRQPVRIEYGSRSIHTAMWGLPPGGELLTLYDHDLQPLRVDDDSPLMMGTVLLRRLGAVPGDTVRVTILSSDPDPPVRAYRLGPELYEPVANPAKLALRTLQKQTTATRRMASDGINVVLLRVRPGEADAVRRRLHATGLFGEVVMIVQYKHDIEHMLRMLNAYKAVMFLFAALLAVGLLGATTAMSVMERVREFAAMTILGVRDRSLRAILLLETLVLWLLGLLLGIPVGIVLGNWLISRYQSDLIQMTVRLAPSTVVETAGFSLLVCLLSIAGSLRAVCRVPLATATLGVD